MVKYEIGIVDTRAVIKTLLEDFGYDFRDYALTSFKRRLEDIITNNGLKDADGLITKLNNNKDFFDQFLYEVAPNTTEMFRDPSFWRALHDNVIPEIMRCSTTKPKIWVASFDSGEELYSLAIILKEMGLLDKVQIIANYISEKNLARIKSGRMDVRNIETNEANYERLNGKFKYDTYYKTDSISAILDTSLISEVKFLKQKNVIEEEPGAIKLVLFRNQMIYQNQLLQDKTIALIANSLVAGGFLSIGIKETLENTNSSNKFTVYNDNEKLYKRKSN